MLIPIVLGAVLGGAFVLAARARGGAAERRMLAVGLFVAAVIYVGFALPHPDVRWLAIEAVGVVVFAGVAWLGLRRSAWWLAVGWLAHVAWDVGLHLDRPQPIVGAWYPLVCVGFDLVVAGALLRRSDAAPAGNPD